MKIPYGESNFEKIVTNNYYYIDRTHYIEMLENLNENYLVFLRPRRFGKSLFCSMLSYYYDVQYKDRFEELFGNFYIGKKPTDRKNNYLVLKLNFSGISTDSNERLFNSFREKIRDAIENCLKKYDFTGDIIANLKSPTYEPADIIRKFLNFINSEVVYQLYILIDEYDLFANELLAFQPNEFQKHFSSTGFIRKFYEQIKEGTENAVVDKIFITGVTPIALDSLSSGFNITENLSTAIEFNEMMGFKEDEVKKIVLEIKKECPKTDSDKMFNDLVRFYDGYKFNHEAEARVFNPEMILYFVSQYTRSGKCKYPDNIAGKNMISDYTKIQQMFKVGDYEKNLKIIDELLNKGEVKSSLIDNDLITENTNWEFNGEEKFISLIFFLGIISIERSDGEDIVFKIPNYVIEKLYLNFFISIIQEKTDIDINVRALKTAISAMAHKGEVVLFVSTVEKLLTHLSNRDYIKFDEKYVKLLIFSYLSLTRMYVTKSEYEVEDGYIDLLMFRRPPYNAKYQFAFEVKYLKKKEMKKDLSALALAKADALEQIQKYRKSDEFSTMENLKTYILIFIGDKCEVCEKVNDEINPVK